MDERGHRASKLGNIAVVQKSKMYRILAFVLFVSIANVVGNPKVRCVHGVWSVDHCVCKENYVGHRCQRKMHCSSFMRNSDGSCVACEKYWEGPNCDSITCNSEFGTATKDLLMCQCTGPAKGDHCELLDTDDIYLHYNQKMEKWGPIGALAIIPMVACLVLCNRKAKHRHVARVERALEDQRDVEVDSKVLEELLHKKH
uniref:EGF-like domain-containing protein n=1 Tax=Plectus sambesii TaxID=2011161 RepID=A0A914XTF5_9BILA